MTSRTHSLAPKQSVPTASTQAIGVIEAMDGDIVTVRVGDQWFPVIGYVGPFASLMLAAGAAVAISETAEDALVHA